MAFSRFSLFLLPTLGWSVSAARMVASARRDLGPTGLPNDLPNWHNWSGDLRTFLALSLVELAFLLAILRPHSYFRAWRRALSALILFVPWTFLFLVLMMHSGGIMVVHFLWLASVCVWLSVLVVISGLTAFAAAGPAPSAQP